MGKQMEYHLKVTTKEPISPALFTEAIMGEECIDGLDVVLMVECVNFRVLPKPKSKDGK